MLLQATPSPAAQGKHIRHKAAYIATQPASQTVTEGQTATFFAGVTGTTPLLYQWKQNGATIAGATSSSYTTPATTRSISGTQFTLTVSNSYGSATSNPAVLTVNAAVAAPIISAEPANLTVTASQSAIFSVAATGTSPFSYQWMRNGAAISGANSATYDIASTSASDSGTRFNAVVANSAGSATSNTATLTVTQAMVAAAISVQPVSQSVRF